MEFQEGFAPHLSIRIPKSRTNFSKQLNCTPTYNGLSKLARTEFKF